MGLVTIVSLLSGMRRDATAAFVPTKGGVAFKAIPIKVATSVTRIRRISVFCLGITPYLDELV
jgi:hypothetical protein